MINIYFGNKLDHSIDEIADKNVKNRLLKITNTKQQVISINVYYYMLEQLHLIDPNIEIIFNKYNKPLVKNHDNLYISLAHCNNNYVFAISNQEIGIDLEYKKTFKDKELKQLYNYILNNNEQLNFSCDSLNLLKSWTIKESFLKLIGIGIQTNLKKVNIVDNTVNLINHKTAYFEIIDNPEYYLAIASFNKDSHQIFDI